MNRHVASAIIALILAIACAAETSAQAEFGTVTVRVLLEGSPVEGVQVTTGEVAGVTGPSGAATLQLPAGVHRLRIEKLGLESLERRVVVRAGADTLVVVDVREEAVEHEEIIVSSTRSDRRIEDEPMRIEVVSREEIEEKLLMTPGDIAMLLNETAGLRVQPTAPALGGANVRIQGLRGRYTQILSDGLPLFGGQTGALGPLQIPPMDLGQVEVIKGVASALYGASALGGVVNLISRRPDPAGERELLLNQSTLGGTDAILWASADIDERWGYTLLASGHRQSDADIDDDGWADLPSFRRAVIRPRLFWENGRGASLLLTVGGLVEEREGGTVEDGTTPAGTTYRSTLGTDRADAGLVGRFLLGPGRLLGMRGSGTLQRHDHRFGEARERDFHGTGFIEAALSGTGGAHTWVIGAAVQYESYDARDVTGFDYAFTVPGLFAQDEVTLSESLALSASARLDHHSRFGSFVNPRISVLARPGTVWTVRASAGTGYFAPTPWIEEVEAVGLGRLTGWRELNAERARSASLDVGWAKGPFEVNATLFGSRIADAVQARSLSSDSARIEVTNAAGPVRTWGTELLVRYHVEGIHVTATHVLTRSTEPDPVTGSRREVPLTPRHTVGLVGAWESEGARVGLEFYFTGRQSLDANPYRNRSPAYFIVGLLAERRLGPVRLFLNAENLLDTRQTRHDPLVLPHRSPDGRWITDVWAPLEGRSFNGGVRWSF